MVVTKHAFPILEHDESPEAIIKADRHGKEPLPRLCLMTFFGEVLHDFVTANDCRELHPYQSEMRDFPVYEYRHNGVAICLVQGFVGSAGAAMLAEFLYAYGVTHLLACGGCGVLQDIPAGDVIIPVTALRDEGASYHYLPPARTIDVDPGMVAAIKETLTQRQVPFTECTTWTTDGFYRETPDMVQYRKDEGCQTVDMECATLAAVARFKGKAFGQILYSGDILADVENYDERGWQHNATAREKLFTLGLDVLQHIGSGKQ
ncbi:nucleoside phosphorylase [Desulfovibrio sp. OttesenSCG-928-I05]|nr:nucleoside phosphorylase [Desulfovibrio sp. OttesenSCG-928-I05]